MCEANAYMLKDGTEELILESVDIVEPSDDGGYRLVSIFGDQKIIKGNITPGAHICCAGEWKFGVAGDNIYAGIGIAIPDDNTNAILFMECVGKSISITNDIIREDIIESIKRIGENQGIRYKEIHVVTDERTIKNDLGCAMVAIPYFLKE